jgi:serine protease AprX
MADSRRIRGPVAAAAIVVAATVIGCVMPSADDHGGRTDATRVVNASAHTGAGLRSVVVMGVPGREAEAARATVAVGGRVTQPLQVIHGFAAQVPTAAVAELRASPAVVSVTPDRTVQVAGASTASVAASAAQPAPAPAAAAQKASAAKKAPPPTTDTGDMSAITQITGARAAWANGITGRGVGVALIDTGVVPVPGLDGTDKVLVGPDLSFDAPGAPVPGLDAYGHGTFMAGIIAGHDVGTSPGDPGALTGVAPDARILNVKVGAADGAADVSQVIAAIDWVTQHAHDGGVDVRVINLSFGTDGTQDSRVDPLAQAAEQAWKHGIVVVAAAGNDGRPTKDLADPARDPYLIAAGGDDPNGTLDPADDAVPTFAQHGTNARPVDVIAPATHVLGLRVPGSFVDTLPTNTGQVGDRFQRGSGTSQAAAVVSGLAALLVQKYPNATPDTVKAMLTGTATPVLRGNGNPNAPGQMLYSGHGLADVAAAIAAGPGGVRAGQTWAPGTGTGTLDGARGSAVVSDGAVPLTGQQDIFGHRFDSAAMADLQARVTAWTGGIWNGARWTGDDWSAGRWTPADWTGTDWAGSRWRTAIWTDMTWTGSRWRGSGWSGSTWAGSRWRTDVWSTGMWE